MGSDYTGSAADNRAIVGDPTGRILVNRVVRPHSAKIRFSPVTALCLFRSAKGGHKEHIPAVVAEFL